MSQIGNNPNIAQQQNGNNPVKCFINRTIEEYQQAIKTNQLYSITWINHTDTILYEID